MATTHTAGPVFLALGRLVRGSTKGGVEFLGFWSGWWEVPRFFFWVVGAVKTDDEWDVII
jgi:hypothetical protein